MSKDNDMNKFIKLIASGPISFELTLILTEEEAELFNVIPKKIHKISDCASFLSHQGNNFFLTSTQSQPKKLNIFDNIRLHSNNRNINTLLYINRAFKKKIFIEYITMNQIKLLEENMFMKDVLKHVTEQNFLFLVENKFLKNLDSEIKFTIKINNTTVACFNNICDNTHEIEESLQTEKTENDLIKLETAENDMENTGEMKDNNDLEENKENKEGSTLGERKSDNESRFNQKIKDMQMEGEHLNSNSMSMEKMEMESKQREKSASIVNNSILKNSNNNSRINSNNNRTNSQVNMSANKSLNQSQNNNNNQMSENKILSNNSNSNNNNLNNSNSNEEEKKQTNSIALDLNVNESTKRDNNENELNSLVPSPVKNRNDKTQNEEDITADKIIKEIKSEGSNLEDNEKILENKDELSGPGTNLSNTESNKNSQNIYERFRYDFSGCNYFLIDLDEILSLKKNNFTLADFHILLRKIIEDFPEINIITNFPNIIKNISKLDIESLNIICNIIRDSDIHIFDKKESITLLNLMSRLGSNEQEFEESKNLEFLYLKEIKKKKAVNRKIGIFIEGLKKATIIQQQPSSNLVVFNTEYNFNLFPPNVSSVVQSDYEKIYVKHYDHLKAVFQGGVLSRLFYKKSFNTCFTAGNELMKKVIELIRFNLNPPSDINYYLVRIKKDPKGKTEEEKILEKKESKFVLDSTNVVRSKMKDYDPLYDNNLSSFFSSKINRSHLEKKGFIDKKGNIMNDPEKRKIAKIETKNIMQIYENEKNHLQRIKEQKEKMRLQIRNLLNTNMKTIKSANLKDLEKLSKIYTYNPMGKNKLPLIDLKTTSMKSTKFKNSVYLKEISKGNKPKSLFDMNTFENKDKDKRDKTNSPSPNIKTSSNRATSNRYMSNSTQRVNSEQRQTEESKSKSKERIISGSGRLYSPVRLKSGSINQNGNHTKSRAESRYTSDKNKSISITEYNINRDINNILNYETKNDDDQIKIDDNAVLSINNNEDNNKEKIINNDNDNFNAKDDENINNKEENNINNTEEIKEKDEENMENESEVNNDNDKKSKKSQKENNENENENDNKENNSNNEENNNNDNEEKENNNNEENKNDKEEDILSNNQQLQSIDEKDEKDENKEEENDEKDKSLISQNKSNRSKISELKNADKISEKEKSPEENNEEDKENKENISMKSKPASAKNTTEKEGKKDSEEVENKELSIEEGLNKELAEKME